jgi:transcription elongation factor GreA
MTANGFKRLQEELKRLKSVERPNVIADIARARELGDLSENAEYHTAKDKQGMIEARIVDLEDKIVKADIVDVLKIRSDEIKFGATIDIEEDETGTKFRFQIVGSVEADVKNGFLPLTSPLAISLIGKKVGDVAEVKTPKGVKFYSVLKIEYC